jgi:hypothetical protein
MSGEKRKRRKGKQWFQFKDFFYGMNIVLAHGEQSYNPTYDRPI